MTEKDIYDKIIASSLELRELFEGFEKIYNEEEKEILGLCNEYPNDQDLGKAVRNRYQKK